jgi:hypothetical protein
MLLNGERGRALLSVAPEDLPPVLLLELVESAMAQPALFLAHPDLAALVRTRLVPLLLRLCSPPTKVAICLMVTSI